METDLVMFGCKQSVIFNLLEPRTFHYMNKYQLIDARREARPLRYSFSRLDTWSSIVCFPVSGTRHPLEVDAFGHGAGLENAASQCR